MPLAWSAQDDFAAGSVRSVARHLIPPNGVYSIENGLLDDDGSVYRRGGSEYLSNAAFGAGGLRWVWDGHLAAGEATLDLRPLAGGGRTVDVEARLGLGELIVLVPADVDLDLDATIGLGQLRLTGPGGTDVAEGGAGISRSTLLEGDGGRRVQLDINVGAGEVEVRRVEAQ